MVLNGHGFGLLSHSFLSYSPDVLLFPKSLPATGGTLSTGYASQCDGRHRLLRDYQRNSTGQHGSEGRKEKTVLEPCDTRLQWKGEATACFVLCGIASSCASDLSVGCWFPNLACVRGMTSASEATGSFGGDFSFPHGLPSRFTAAQKRF